jgi:uncharacterized protein YndB with AHSA1/START domain
MNATITMAPVRKSIRVKAARQRAFEIFTQWRWWPKEHSILKSRSPQVSVTTEPRAGGRWYERGADGSECDWGKVLVWEPPSRIVMTWQLNGRFEIDPALHTEVEVRFVAEGDHTRIELEHRYLERAGDTAQMMRDAIDSPGGWGGLLERFAAAVRDAPR